MGIAFNSRTIKRGFGYKSSTIWKQPVSLNQAIKRLTPQNIIYLKSLGLKIKNSGLGISLGST